MLAERPPFYLKDWSVQPTQLRIISPEGISHTLEPRVMDVLLCLVEQPNKVVLRQTLMDHVWKECIVVDDTLTRCISQLRKVLNDNPDEPAFIETIRSKGYRLLVVPSEIPNQKRHVTPVYRMRNRISRSLVIAGVIACIFGIGWHAGFRAHDGSLMTLNKDGLNVFVESDSTVHPLSLSGTEGMVFFLDGDAPQRWVQEKQDSVHAFPSLDALD